MNRWKDAVNSSNPEDALNVKDLDGKYINHLPSVVKLPNSANYIFLKKGKETDNSEIYPELINYTFDKDSIKSTHDLVFNNELNRYFYIKKQTPKKEEGGKITKDSLKQMIVTIIKELLG